MLITIACIASLTTVAWSGTIRNRGANPSFKLGDCEGDCDSDANCKTGYQCYHDAVPPGCRGSVYKPSTGPYDYCGKWRPGILGNVAANPSKKLRECEGDCDRDSDCQSGLKCYHDAAPPGCSGSVFKPSTGPYDYCGKWKPGIIGNVAANPGKQLLECEGDCDSNSDCVGSLLCYHDAVPPGCRGSVFKPSTGPYDYCGSWKRGILGNLGANPNIGRKLKGCEGDCDRDSDCESGLQCVHNMTPYGCSGMKAKSDYDYCSLEPTPAPTQPDAIVTSAFGSWKSQNNCHSCSSYEFSVEIGIEKSSSEEVSKSFASSMSKTVESGFEVSASVSVGWGPISADVSTTATHSTSNSKEHSKSVANTISSALTRTSTVTKTQICEKDGFYQWVMDAQMSRGSPFEVKAEAYACMDNPLRPRCLPGFCVDANCQKCLGDPDPDQLTPLKDLGWSPKGPLNECEGDCDSNTDCKGYLVCVHDRIPRVCTGTSPHSLYDWCGRVGSAHSVNEDMDTDLDEYDGVDYDEMTDDDLSDESVVPAGGWSITVHYYDLIMALGVLLVVLCAVNLGVMLCRRGKAKMAYSPVKFAAESDTEMDVEA